MSAKMDNRLAIQIRKGPGQNHGIVAEEIT